IITSYSFFCIHATFSTTIYPLSLHDALPILIVSKGYELPNFVGESSLVFAISFSGNTEETVEAASAAAVEGAHLVVVTQGGELRSEEHTSELQSRSDLVCRLLLEKKKH